MDAAGIRENGTEKRRNDTLTGDLHERNSFVLVLHTGQVDDDRVALTEDLRLGHAERIDALTNLLHGQVEAGTTELGAGLGFLRDGHATL